VQDLLAQFTIRLACVRLQVTPTADNLVSDLRGGTLHRINSVCLGVTEGSIAQSLDVDVAAIRRKRNLLDGVCPDASERGVQS
jgi:hypothetical protein